MCISLEVPVLGLALQHRGHVTTMHRTVVGRETTPCTTHCCETNPRNETLEWSNMADAAYTLCFGLSCISQILAFPWYIAGRESVCPILRQAEFCSALLIFMPRRLVSSSCFALSAAFGQFLASARTWFCLGRRHSRGTRPCHTVTVIENCSTTEISLSSPDSE